MFHISLLISYVKYILDKQNSHYQLLFKSQSLYGFQTIAEIDLDMKGPWFHYEQSHVTFTLYIDQQGIAEWSPTLRDEGWVEGKRKIVKVTSTEMLCR